MKKKLLFTLIACLLLCLSSSFCAADDWADVQAAGVLRFGTASDYYPFVYMDETTLDGLDIALVKEIGSRLGVEVKAIDIAFDGLIDAVNVGQVDLIGGGFSITEARRELVDYTLAYYQAGGVILCRADAPVTQDTVTSAKIGVEKGTSFEQWVASNMVMGGQISPKNVLTYSKGSYIIDALKDKNIDMALVDEDFYRSLYKNDAELVVVENNAVNEKYAYAAAKGSTLIPEVNRVFREMVKDGTAQKIADKYFGMDFSDRISYSITRPSQAITPTEVVPTDLIQSRELTEEEVRASNAPNCYNAMQYVSDISIPDRTQLLPNLSATKTWRIKNTGTCTWDSTYTFNYVKGYLNGNAQVKINKLVEPNSTCDISVNFTTPASNGEYTSYWQMQTPSGANFGQTIWVDFRVSASTGSADMNVQKGEPKILKWQPDFYSTDKGNCPNVYYQVTNASRVDFFVNNVFQSSSTDLKGYVKLCPSKKTGTYTFAIRAVGESSLSTAFQFVNNTQYSDSKLGYNKDFPQPVFK